MNMNFIINQSIIIFNTNGRASEQRFNFTDTNTSKQNKTKAQTNSAEHNITKLAEKHASYASDTHRPSPPL